MSLGLIIVVTSCSKPENINQTNTPVTENQAKKEIKLTLVSYAVTQSAYEKIIPKFVEQWQQKTGQLVTFDQSYGGSGSQTRAVIDGLEADIVALALASDVEKIAKAGLIQEGWEKEAPHNSIVTKSVIAFVTRENGKKVTNWQDLSNPDIKVITANPKTSGGARWNFLGLWGAITQAGGDEAKAEEYVTKVFQNAPILPKDAREATDVFYKQGQGDVLLNYENEVLLAKLKGENQPYTIPTDFNVSIDAPVTVVDSNVDKKGTKEVAEAFVQYLFTPEAQKEFAQVGFRPVDEKIAQEFSQQYPQVKNLATVETFGGWEKVQSQFFDDGGIFDRLFTKINKK